MERARRGDQDAYGELVTRYQALAARVAYVITASPAEAEDVTQDAFVKAYYALDRFREGAPFRPWLLRIVANEAKNRKA
ncbi:MAG: siderophore-interacting protein, partial [Chloroflexota bacterium]|nr:siderophore-interacting protein [Chloroflexota bacterium]